MQISCIFECRYGDTVLLTSFVGEISGRDYLLVLQASCDLISLSLFLIGKFI